MLPGKWREFVLLQEVVNAHSQELGNQAYMIAMVKPMQ
jgi:hypothetical protein